MTLNFTHVSENFEKARFLLEEESKKDPENEPYKSKYAAKELFLSLKSTLKKHQDQLQHDDDDESLNKPQYLTAVLDYYIGLICIETDELSTGEEHLSKCVEMLNGAELRPECIIVVLSALNQLGILYSRRTQAQKSKMYLAKAEELYNRYMPACGKPPYTAADLFAENVKAEKLDANFQELENVMTHTQYYLAQVCSSLNDTHRAAAYCHSTLKRQLESKEFDPVDWSINAATLSQFFLSRNKFDYARHHLACAVFVLEQHESGLQSTENTGEEFESKWETLKQRKADVARCWVKYAQVLLTTSKENLISQTEDEEITDDGDEGEERNNSPPAEGSSSSSSKEKANVQMNNEENQRDDIPPIEELEMLFKSLEVTSVEDQVTANLVLDYSQARQVFLNAQKWMNVAKEYYTLEDHASDHIQLSQEVSILYKLLAFFEPNSDRQCKMHKRRVDLLEAVLKELNPQYYLDKCRQLQFELGEIYCDILDTKATMVRDGEAESSSHAVQKMNHLAKQSIHYFTTFLGTFVDSNHEMPKQFADEIARPILLAHFFIGRLYSKINTRDAKKELDYLKQSKHNYQYIISYCNENASTKDLMQEELYVCKEMVKLLQVKMEKMLSLI